MLDHLLLTDADVAAVVSGFSRDDAALGCGPLTLDEAALAEADPHAERARLQTHGYRRGHSRAWRDAEGDVVFVSLYELRDALAARWSLLDGHDALVASGLSVAEVPGLDPAWAATAPDGAFVGHLVGFALGPCQALVVVGGTSRRARPRTARRLAKAQRERMQRLQAG